MPLAVLGAGLAGVFIVSNTWQKVNDLIPSFDGALDGISNAILGDQATKEAILREADKQAEQAGKPLTLRQKMWNRFALQGFGGIGFY